MAEEKIYTKRCKTCGEIFETDKVRGRVCEKCKKATKLRLARERYDDYKKPSAERKGESQTALDDFVLLLTEYNAKNNTNYSYGEFTSAIKLGKIKFRNKKFH